MMRWCVCSGVPRASTSTTRPVSRRAIARYACRTRRKNARLSCSNRFSSFSEAPSRRLLRVPPPCAVHARRHVRVHQDRQIRLQVAAQNPMQFEHRFTSQLPAPALVRLRRIRKTIADSQPSRSRSPAESLLRICCAREANISAISAMDDSAAVFESSKTCRIFSPVSVPPGSRVTTTATPRALQYALRVFQSACSCRCRRALQT